MLRNKGEYVQDSLYTASICYTKAGYSYICNHLEYRSHTKPAFLKLKTLTIADLVKFKSMVLMYKIYNNLMPSNIVLSYFCMVHDHDTRQAGHFKNITVELR